MTRCEYCGLTHDTICPRIQAIEYHPDGAIKRVEFVKIKVFNPSVGNAAGQITVLTPFYTGKYGPNT
jgi:hypothetical protein